MVETVGIEPTSDMGCTGAFTGLFHFDTPRGQERTKKTRVVVPRQTVTAGEGSPPHYSIMTSRARYGASSCGTDHRA